MVNDVQRIIRSTDTAIKGRIICKLILYKNTGHKARGKDARCLGRSVRKLRQLFCETV